ncbi:tryptophan synthase subunit alpha [Hutsoniella sourekii]
MSKLAAVFAEGKAFIPYITAGYPDLESTEAYIQALAQEGASIIEIGIPFSDPTAEGPVIQHAIEQALDKGIRTDDIFDMVARLEDQVSVPLVFMTYANIVFGYGLEAFFQRCQAVGIQGLILPDVPYEEKEELASYTKKYGIPLISLIAPTSKERISQIAGEADGFLYVVSSLGLTGTRESIQTDLSSMIQSIRQANPDLPAAIGFGISGPDQALQMAQLADGVIIGSAIMKLIDQYQDQAEPAIRDYARTIVEAIR